MHLSVPRPDPAIATESLAAHDFATLTRHLAGQGGMTLVYAPSTTTITNTAPGASAEPVEVRVTAPAGAVGQAPTQTTTTRPRYTLGEVVAYSGATLMGGAVLSGLISALLAVPMLLPLLSGITALAGMLAAIAGAMLDNRERG